MLNVSIRQSLIDAQSSLVDSDSPKLDAEILLCHVLGKSREYLVSHGQEEMPSAALDAFHAQLQRRQAGEPIAYIIGKRGFWDIELAVNSSVLVPRPETELLVETALELFDGDELIQIADLGTGSGAIALALAKANPKWKISAVDISEVALATAKSNAKSLGVDNVEFMCGSWCEGLEENAFDLIIANPPYVAPGDAHLQEGDLRFEPNLALESLEGGFADLFAIATQARSKLHDNGYLLMEHGFDQHQALCEKLQALGYAQVSGRTDLAGHVRMIQGLWLGENQ